MEFYIGQLFVNEYPQEAAQWCNERKDCYIKEIESVNNVRQFELVAIPKETIEQKERERIAQLFLTGADVERGIYKAKGMDFDDIIAFVSANPLDGLDIKALKIELKANNFYRGNPYVSAVGALLGFSSEQLDRFFESGDYTVLLEKFELE